MGIVSVQIIEYVPASGDGVLTAESDMAPGKLGKDMRRVKIVNDNSGSTPLWPLIKNKCDL